MRDEARGEAFHLADLVHQVKFDAPLARKRRVTRAIDGRHVDAVLPHATCFWQLDVRDQRFAAVVGDEPKAAALAALANFGGVEAGDARIGEALGEAAHHGGLAGPGRAVSSTYIYVCTRRAQIHVRSGRRSLKPFSKCPRPSRSPCSKIQV